MNELTPPRKVLLGIPSYTGAVSYEIIQRIEEWKARSRHKIDWICIGKDVITRVRNEICHVFLHQHQGHKLIMADDDIYWEGWQLDRLIDHDVDVVAGMCPKKKTRLEWVGVPVASEAPTDKGLQKMEYVGSGLVCIDSGALQRLMGKDRYRVYFNDPVPGQRRYDFWPIGVNKCVYESEDWAFCRMMRESGTEIYADLSVQVQHEGRIKFPLHTSVPAEDMLSALSDRLTVLHQSNKEGYHSVLKAIKDLYDEKVSLS